MICKLTAALNNVLIWKFLTVMSVCGQQKLWVCAPLCATTTLLSVQSTSQTIYYSAYLLWILKYKCWHITTPTAFPQQTQKNLSKCSKSSGRVWNDFWLWFTKLFLRILQINAKQFEMVISISWNVYKQLHFEIDEIFSPFQILWWVCIERGSALKSGWHHCYSRDEWEFIPEHFSKSWLQLQFIPHT